MFVPNKNFFLVLLILLLPFMGCGGGGDAVFDEPANFREDLSTDTLTVAVFDYTPSYKTILIEPEDLEHLMINSAVDQIVVQSSSRFYSTIKQWDILIAGISERFPHGLFKRVRGLNISPGSLELFLDQPSLEGAFKYLKMDMSKKILLSESTLEESCIGVNIEDSGENFYLNLNAVVYDLDKDLSTTNDQVRVTGNIEFEISFQLVLDINLWKLQSLSFKPVVKETAQLTFSSDLAHIVNESIVLGEVKADSFELGPLVFTPEFKLLLNTNGKLSTQTKTGMSWTHVYEHDFLYNGTNLFDLSKKNEQVSVADQFFNIEAAINFEAEFSSEMDLNMFGISLFSCNDKDYFTYLGVIKTDSDSICLEQTSGFDSSTQVNLDFVSSNYLESEEMILSYSGDSVLFSKDCFSLFDYHPVALGGQDQTCMEGDKITLDGTSSYDLDDAILSYEWKQIKKAGQSETDIELIVESQGVATFIAPQVSPNGQELFFDLEITDLSGNVDRDTVVINISDADGLPEIEGTLIGRIVDFTTDLPVSGVSVEVFETKVGENHEQSIGFSTSDSQGSFEISSLSPNCRIEFSKIGYIPVSLDGITIGSNSETDLGELSLLDDSHNGQGSVSISLVDFISGAKLTNGNIILKKYTGGETLVTDSTDSDGRCFFEKLALGAYYATASATGYRSKNFKVAAHGNVTEWTEFMEPVLGSMDEIRIVLSWGPSTLDLDSHLVAPTSSGERFHLFYPYLHISNPEYANLILDQDAKTSGGIETIIIKNRFSGTYTYQVHNRTNNDSLDSMAFSLSGAMVSVFKGYEQVDLFIVPDDMPGNLWEVMTIDGASGQITPVNSMENKTLQELIRLAGSYDTSYNDTGK